MANQAVSDPRRERQQFLLGVLRIGTPEERRRALRELALIGDADAACAIRDHAPLGSALGDPLRRATIGQIIERERGLVAIATYDEPDPLASYLPGNFADLQLPAPPPYDPLADRVTRDRAKALEYLTHDEVEDRLTALAALACLGDATHLLVVCRALMAPEPRVQYAARLAYRKILERLRTGEPIRLPATDAKPPPPGTHRQQLLRRVTEMVREDQRTREPISLGPEHIPSFVEVIAKAMTNSTPPPPPPPEEQTRLNRQAELLRLLASGNEPTQWIAIKELAKVGDPDAAAQVFPFLHSENREVAEAARLAYRQMKERELLGAVVTPDDQAVPPQGAPDAPELEKQYLAEQALPPVTPPAAPLPPPVAATLSAPPPPPPPPRSSAPAGQSVPVFTPSDFGDDEGRTEPLPVSGGAFGAPTTDPQEAALLPDDDDLGLLPQ